MPNEPKDEPLGGWGRPRKRAWKVDPRNPFTKTIKPADEREFAAADLKASTDLTDSQIAKQVGLPDAEAVRQAMRLPQVQGYLSKELDDAGATLSSAAKVIAEAQQAERVTHFSFQGECDRSQDAVDVDFPVRLAAAELNLKARGVFRETQANQNIFLGLSDAQVAAIADGRLDPATLIDVGPRIENPAGRTDPPGAP